MQICFLYPLDQIDCTAVSRGARGSHVEVSVTQHLDAIIKCFAMLQNIYGVFSSS